MKKIFVILSLAALAVSSLSASNTNYYVEVKHGIAVTEAADKGLEEPMANIVGGDSIRTELEVGYFVKGNIKAFPKASKLYVFGYGWKYDKEKYDEKGVGIGIKWQSGRGRETQDIYLQLKASSGFGWQENDGKEFVAETNSALISYVTNNIKSGSFPATFYKTTTVFEINLGVDFIMKITEGMQLSAGYTYLHRYYNYGYSIEGGYAEISGSVQSGHYFNAGLSYNF